RGSHPQVAVVTTVLTAAARATVLLTNLGSIDPAQTSIVRIKGDNFLAGRVVGSTIDPVAADGPELYGLGITGRLLGPEQLSDGYVLADKLAGAPIVVEGAVITGAGLVMSGGGRGEQDGGSSQYWNTLSVRGRDYPSDSVYLFQVLTPVS